MISTMKPQENHQVYFIKMFFFLFLMKNVVNSTHRSQRRGHLPERIVPKLKAHFIWKYWCQLGSRDVLYISCHSISVNAVREMVSS